MRIIFEGGGSQMKTIDRLLIAVLAVGVWVLVFKPILPEAHSGQLCEISGGTGYGDVEDGSVSGGYIDGDYLYGASLSNTSVNVHSIRGEVYCY